MLQHGHWFRIEDQDIADLPATESPAIPNCSLYLHSGSQRDIDLLFGLNFVCCWCVGGGKFTTYDDLRPRRKL